MTGGALGALEGHLLPHVFAGFWAMAGLAAVVGGVMRSPLTGIVFTCELTGAWDSLLGLVVASVSAVSSRVTVYADSTLREVANELARRDATAAAVIDRAVPGRVVGELTLDQLLHARREDLREEEHRERPLPLVLIPAVPRPGRNGREAARTPD